MKHSSDIHDPDRRTNRQTLAAQLQQCDDRMNHQSTCRSRSPEHRLMNPSAELPRHTNRSELRDSAARRCCPNATRWLRTVRMHSDDSWTRLMPDMLKQELYKSKQEQHV